MLRALAAEHNLCDALLGLEKTAPGKPCFGFQIKRCRGACLGNEPHTKHSMRLVGALSRLKLATWPVDGPALLREGDEVHLIDGWRYLGSARHDEQVFSLLDAGRPPFDRDTYKILAKYVGRLVPLARGTGRPAAA